jgi:outer membrane protein OmpA-like peptidoglycan-associated protein
MNISKIVSLSLCLMTLAQLQAQQIKLEGYVFESNNRGYLKSVKVLVLDKDNKQVYLDTQTDANGVFSGQVPKNKDLSIIAEKDHFYQRDTIISTRNLTKDAVFVKIAMDRKPGYVFDVTMAQKGDDLFLSESIQGARIEVYNNTTSKEELVLIDYPYPNFKFTFENGNHYTLMIRKKGFFNKRMEAYVNIEGCILCFDGLGIVSPGVTDVMTDNNKQGTFLANVDLQPAKLNTTFRIENIYYDYNKYDIRPDAALELDKLITVIKDNPALKLEMGSHTDARGTSTYNNSLSEKRAAAAVDYLVAQGVDPSGLTAKGYGESVLANRCANGVSCSEVEHQYNRRTELKIIGIAEEDPLDKKSLKEILTEEKLMKEVENSPVIKGKNR